MMDNLSASRLLGSPWLRRAILGALAAVLAVLTLFPREYRAAVSLTPTDPSALGLSGALGQLGALSNVFGSQAATEISLKVARSMDVRRKVVEKLDLVRRLNLADHREADRWLERKVEIRSLRGGILQMSMKYEDPQLARDIVATWSEATRNRLAEISRTQTAYKRKVLEDLVSDAGDRYSSAQAAYDRFRRGTRFAEPTSSLGAIGQRVPALQSAIKSREIELRTARQFNTERSYEVQQIVAEIGALRTQLAQAERLDSGDPDSVNRVIVQSTQAEKLERELTIARGLYVSYQRFLEGTSVEDLTSSGNVRVLEPPYVDSSRQFRTLPLALLALTILLWLAIELYQLRPPLGADARRLRTA